MRRFLWPLSLLVVCLPLILLAAGVKLPWLSPGDQAEPEPVPAGEFEIAWLNTATSGGTWERFVAGVQAASRAMPELTVETSNAFPAQSTDVPEVVVSGKGEFRTLRIRWYKLTTKHKEKYWVEKLAAREPAPLAFIGGASSDRARDLAVALNHQTVWRGERPLFFITNATAETVFLGDSWKPLIDLYAGRSFRVCFSNNQMAEAMLDFVWQNPDLAPRLEKPMVLRISWDDDPYSVDMVRQVESELARRGRNIDGTHYRVPFSVGGFNEPNLVEKKSALDLLATLREKPEQRALVVVPTVTAPARRFLRTLADGDAEIAKRLVALNGDGMGVNVVLRDGECLWPDLPMPFVIFTHAHPTDWIAKGLSKPSSTDDVLHFSNLIRLISKEANALTGADQLAQRLHAREKPFFDSAGNRLSGTGEFIFLLQPGGEEGPRYEVWQRRREASWHLVGRNP